ncbi:MAG: NHLP bacteriocin export ABC transporter permease/ATPase subunit [Chamaesiphon sp.]|nr:NHLP bacteriocin export ABC transporter permease/ATPase subunit [Chamaesiphon sp.]
MMAIDLRGTSSQLHGSQPLPLNDPQQVWVVEAGSIAIFVITTESIDNPQEGSAIGQRQYLCTLEPQAAMFGATDPSVRLLAVPLGSARILKLDPQCWVELCQQSDPRISTWLQNWFDLLVPILATQPFPTAPVQAELTAHYSLIDRQTLQTTDVCWVEMQSGTACLQGIEELILTAEALPLPAKIWLSSVGEVQIATHPLNNISPTALLSGLERFHRCLFQSIRLSNACQLQVEQARLTARTQLNQEVTLQTLESLAGTLPNPQRRFMTTGDPLLQVVGAVGHILGMEIRPPARSDRAIQSKDPLAAIVRASRLRMRRVLLRDRWWEQDNGSLIAYTKTDLQPIALLPTQGRRYEVFQPPFAQPQPITESLAATISPVAYMLYRSLPDRAIRAFDILKFSLQGRQGDILAIVFTAVLVALLGLAIPYATQIIMDSAIPDSDRGLLLQIGLGLLVAALGTACFQLAQGFSLLRLETTTDHVAQAGVWDRLLNLPVSFFRQYTTGDLQSRVSSVSAIRRQLSGRNLVNLVSSFFTLFYLAQLFYYSYELALVAVGIASVTIVVTIACGLLLLSKVRPLLEVRGEIFGQTVQLMNGIAKLHIAGAEERAFAAWSKKFSRQVKLESSTQSIEDFVVLFNTVMPIASSGLLFWFAIRMLDRPVPVGTEAIAFSLGTFLAFNSAFGRFTQGTTLLSNTVTEILQVIPQWQRTRPILQAVPEIDLTKADPGRLSGRVSIERVTFRYQLDAPLILNDISIQAAPGEFIALVGASGSGKSTILRLLLGFESPQNGAIFYDGQDLAGLDVDAVRRQFGVVLQQGQLTSASIFENISGSGQITLDDAWSAARMAGLAKDIEDMPMQMHTMVSEGGGNISGGQRQRLLIARALVHKPRILLFDEATSALDNTTQAIVSQSLDRLQVTRIVIAHRLSTIQNADRIYVLEKGQIVQHGKFSELAANSTGLFARLISRQVANA